MTEASVARRCLNCDASLSGPYCSLCGQADQAVRVSVRQLAADFFAEHVGLDSKVARTFWALARKPGLKSQLNYTDSDRAQMDSAGLPRDTVIGAAIVASDSLPGGVEALLEKRVRRFNAMSDVERVSYFQSAFARYMPNAIFLLLPFFSLLLYWLYRSSGRFYAEHLIFTLHVHSFAFAAMIVSLFLPDALEFVAPFWIIAYLFLAMRRVYAEPRGRTAAKFAGLAVPYLVALLAVTMAVLFLIFAFG